MEWLAGRGETLKFREILGHSTDWGGGGRVPGELWYFPPPSHLFVGGNRGRPHLFLPRALPLISPPLPGLGLLLAWEQASTCPKTAEASGQAACSPQFWPNFWERRGREVTRACLDLSWATSSSLACPWQWLACGCESLGVGVGVWGGVGSAWPLWVC